MCITPNPVPNIRPETLKNFSEQLVTDVNAYIQKHQQANGQMQHSLQALQDLKKRSDALYAPLNQQVQWDGSLIPHLESIQTCWQYLDGEISNLTKKNGK